MKIVLAADHGGFALKEEVKKWLAANGYEYTDVGSFDGAAVDYPVIAKAGTEKIVGGECTCGLFFCGTGIGISMAANKVRGIRAAVCTDPYCVEMTRRHNNANVLCMGGRIVGTDLALKMVQTFLTTDFDGGERHERRIAMLED